MWFRMCFIRDLTGPTGRYDSFTCLNEHDENTWYYRAYCMYLVIRSERVFNANTALAYRLNQLIDRSTSTCRSDERRPKHHPR